MSTAPSEIVAWLFRLLFLAFFSASAQAAPPPPGAVDPNRIEAFVREGCPHCAHAEEFLAQLQKERPSLTIVVRDLQQEPAALERLKELAQQTATGTVRVPAISVLSLLPGSTVTEFAAAADELPHEGASAADVVADALAALGHQPSVINGWFNWARANAGMRLLPRSVLALMAKGVIAKWVTPPRP